MNDVAPELLEKITKIYTEKKEGSAVLAEIAEAIKKGEIKYEDVYRAAREIGGILGDAYGGVLNLDVLPDGKMYYNIALRVVGQTMEQAYSDVADIAEETQNILNQNAGIGIKAIRPGLNEDRISGIINRLSNAETFEDISWILRDPINTFCQSIVDDAVKQNVEFQGKAGLEPRIIRKTAGSCCEWCSRLAGEYFYPDVPHDVYRRHENCNCTVEFDPGTGKKHQDVWSKKWKYEKDFDRIRERSQIGITEKRKFQSRELLIKHFEKHQQEYGTISMQEYLNQATILANEQLSEDVVQLKRSDNSIAKYRFSTNDFVVINEDGTLRTFFKPVDKEEYWKYEIERN